MENVPDEVKQQIVREYERLRKRAQRDRRRLRDQSSQASINDSFLAKTTNIVKSEYPEGALTRSGEWHAFLAYCLTHVVPDHLASSDLARFKQDVLDFLFLNKDDL